MQPTLRQLLLGLRILHGAMFAPLAVYGALLFVAMKPHASQIDPLVVALVMGGVSVVIFVGIIPYLRRMMMPERRTGGDALDLGAPADAGLLKVVGKLRTASILSWAFGESIGMFGLVGAFLTSQPLLYLPFAGVAAIALAIYAPTRAQFESVIRAAR